MEHLPHGTIAHMAVNADDVGASRRFYESCFGWRFEPWGPPEFFHIQRSDGTRPGLQAALQLRRDLRSGERINAFETTVAVDDAEAAAAAAVRAGGVVLMEKTTIVGVGDLVWLRDPAGNVVGAMRYETGAV